MASRHKRRRSLSREQPKQDFNYNSGEISRKHSHTHTPQAKETPLALACPENSCMVLLLTSEMLQNHLKTTSACCLWEEDSLHSVHKTCSRHRVLSSSAFDFYRCRHGKNKPINFNDGRQSEPQGNQVGAFLSFPTGAIFSIVGGKVRGTQALAKHALTSASTDSTKFLQQD